MLLTGKTRTEVTLFWGRKSRDDFLMVSVLCMSVIAVFFLQPMKLTPFLYVQFDLTSCLLFFWNHSESAKNAVVQCYSESKIIQSQTYGDVFEITVMLLGIQFLGRSMVTICSRSRQIQFVSHLGAALLSSDTIIPHILLSDFTRLMFSLRFSVTYCSLSLLVCLHIRFFMSRL